MKKSIIASLLTVVFNLLLWGNSSMADSYIRSGYETFSNNCLEKYYGKPEELLTMEVVSKFIDFKGAEVKLEKLPDQYVRNKDYATVNCEWKIDKKRYKIQLKGIFKMKLYDKTPVDRFYQKYHTRNQEESEELKKTYDSEVTKKAENKNAEMVSDAMDFDFEYIQVSGIGDAAVWEHKVSELKVLVGEYQFTISVKLNKGNDNNLEKARLIAGEIVRKACD